MTLDQTRRLVGTARQMGFSRRELFKMTLVAAGAVAVAACSGEDAGSAVVEKFAVGTWKIRYQRPSSGSTTGSPDAPVDTTITINADGTYTGGDDLPESGTWTVGKGFVQVSGVYHFSSGSTSNRQGMASNVPETMTESATIDWQWDTGTRTVPATWDSGSKTLTLTATTHGGIQFPVQVTKQ